MARTSTRPRRTSHFSMPSGFELFALSRNLVLKNFWLFAPIYTIPLIFAIHSWIWTPAAASSKGYHWTDYSWFGAGFSGSSVPVYLWYALVGFSVFWLIFVLAAGSAYQIMVQQAELKAASGHRVTFKNLWQTVKDKGKDMFVLYLLIAGYIVVALVPLMVYLLLGLPKILSLILIFPVLVMAHRFFLAPYVMLDKNVTAAEAMNQSSQFAREYPRNIWEIINIMLLIGVLNIIPFLGWLISFILGFLYCCAPALRYQHLKQMAPDIIEAEQ